MEDSDLRFDHLLTVILDRLNDSEPNLRMPMAELSDGIGTPAFLPAPAGETPQIVMLSYAGPVPAATGGSMHHAPVRRTISVDN
jgi:hypothetical protein